MSANVSSVKRASPGEFCLVLLSRKKFLLHSILSSVANLIGPHGLGWNRVPMRTQSWVQRGL